MFSHLVKRTIQRPSHSISKNVNRIMNTLLPMKSSQPHLPFHVTSLSSQGLFSSSLLKIPAPIFRKTHPLYAFGRPMGTKRHRSHLGSGYQPNPPPKPATQPPPASSSAPGNAAPTYANPAGMAGGSVGGDGAAAMAEHAMPETIHISKWQHFWMFWLKPGSGLQALILVPLTIVMIGAYRLYLKYYSDVTPLDSLDIALKKKEHREQLVAKQNEKLKGLADEISQSLIVNKVDATAGRKGSIPGVLTDFEYPEPISLEHRIPIAHAHAAARMIYADYVGKGHYIIYTNHSSVPIHHIINKIMKDNPGMPFTYEVKDPEF